MTYILTGDCLAVMPTLEAESVDAIVSDPPYGLAFMGKAWDHGVPGPEFWREALRVAKPGAHLVAFGGSRTYHRLTCAIEDAGWEIRDCLSWLYGSGFPKSLDVSKAMDKMDAAEEQLARRYRFTEWVRSTGATSRQIDEATATNMGGHYTTSASQPAIMTREHLEACRHLLGGADIPEWVERECDIRSVESRNFAERKVLAHRTMTQGGGNSLQIRAGERREVEANITAPATTLAREWQGWGTALKPAWEPIILARKPLTGTVAANVTQYGTGALNVDATRIGTEATIRPNGPIGFHGGGSGGVGGSDSGRWPANVCLDDEAAAMLDAQTGTLKPATSRTDTVSAGLFHGGNAGTVYGDSGGASRFFYTAKASRREREAGLEGMPIKTAAKLCDTGYESDTRFDGQPQPKAANHHPTVKPIALMRWLCRLVTPKGGLILDPFTGSGTTGCASVLEGFRFVGIEREPEYAAIAEKRIAHWAGQVEEPTLFG